MKKKRIKNGFTMVELLAVIVILGILAIISITAVQGIIAKAKERYYKSQEENMVMAAQSYLKNNRTQQPKVSGQTRTIKLDTLYSSKYIDKVVDYKKETCDGAESYVKAFKYEDDIYYTAYLKCPNYTTDLNVLTSSINISANFEGDNQNVKNAKSTITITDSNGGDGRIAKGIISYQYSIYKENKLIYSSDVFNTKKTDTVTKTVSLSENVPGKIKISVTATNLHGLTKTKSFTHNYTDSTAPTCGAISGDSTTWKHGTRIVTVACNDGNGSGCKRDSYTYEFTGDVKEGKIKIEDKAGNSTTCKVNVYIDNYPPVVTLKAYKKKAGELAGIGNVMNQITNSKSEPNKNFTISNDTVRGWLNKEKWPNGVYLELSYSDISSVSKVEWNWNAVNLPKTASNLNTLIYNLTQTPNNASGVVNEKIEMDGYRYGEVTITDQFNQKSVIKITAPLDRELPQMSVTGASSSWINTDRTINIGCADTVSGCKTTPFKDVIQSTLQNKNYTIEDNAGNKATRSVDVYVDKTPPTCGTRTNEGKSTNWISTDRTVKVGCTDTHSKCTKNEFSQTFNTTTGKGKIQIKDGAGNTTDCEVGVYVDKTPPTCKKIDGQSTSWTNGNRPITVTCDDNGGSGCVKPTYSQTFNSNMTTSTIQIKDSVGWTTNCSVNVYIDKTGPTCGNRSGEGSSSNWTNGSRTITVGCNDDGGSGCPPVSKTFDSEMTTNKITVKDGAGNTRDCDVNVYIDKTKPSISYDIYKIDDWGNWVGGYNSGEWSTKAIRRKLSPSDNNGGSGVNHTEWSSDGSNWNYEGNVSQWDFHEGTNDTYFRTIDNAGNVSSKIHFVLKVDKYAPQFKSEINYYDAAWGGPNDRFGWNMYENASGVNSGSTIFEYCYSGYNNKGCGATCDKGNRYSHRPAHVNSDDWHYFQDATHLDAYNYQTGDYELSGGAVCNVSGHHIRTYFKVCDHAGNCDQRSKIFYK